VVIEGRVFQADPYVAAAPHRPRYALPDVDAEAGDHPRRTGILLLEEPQVGLQVMELRTAATTTGSAFVGRGPALGAAL
jgi:hypothetical protein